MRIAVIADIHGNILALEAVLADLARRGGADLVINLGDCVSGPLWPRETMERLEALGWPTVRGNHDRRVALDPLAEMGPSDKFAHDRLTPEQRDWLAALPVQLEVAPRFSPSTRGPTMTSAILTEASSKGGWCARRSPRSASGWWRSIRPAASCFAATATAPNWSNCRAGRSSSIRAASAVRPMTTRPSRRMCPSRARRMRATASSSSTQDGAADGSRRSPSAMTTKRRPGAPQQSGRPEWAHALRTGFIRVIADGLRSPDRTAQRRAGGHWRRIVGLVPALRPAFPGFPPPALSPIRPA